MSISLPQARLRTVKRKMGKATSHTRLTPYLRGAIMAFALAGYSLDDIRSEVCKPDGAQPSKTAIAQTIALCRANGGFSWDGIMASSPSVGKPRLTTKALDKKIQAFVFKHRGRAKVTVALVKKKIKEARRLSTRTLARRLEEAGLTWLRRRRKSIVPHQHKEPRKAFARWVLRRTLSTLRRWAFTDGTAFYLARSATELQDSVRAALGPMVWRMADGSDALYEDCLGPSSYKKSQGRCIRIWGLLLAGAVFIYVLPDGECMNRWRYQWVLQHMFPKWIRKALGRRRKVSYLIQDHERALWTAEPRKAMREIGVKLLESYPKCSQDLNPIATVWREIRARLNDTEPQKMEARKVFLQRLRNAVAWVNTSRSNLLKELCEDQKDRAKEVLERKGGRTSF